MGIPAYARSLLKHFHSSSFSSSLNCVTIHHFPFTLPEFPIRLAPFSNVFLPFAEKALCLVLEDHDICPKSLDTRNLKLRLCGFENAVGQRRWMNTEAYLHVLLI